MNTCRSVLESRLLVVFFLAISVAFSLPCSAHRLEVTAFAVGERIEGSVYVPGGGQVPGARIELSAADGRLLAELESDAQGRFVYQSKEAVDVLIRVETADGHAAERLVAAEELAGAQPTPQHDEVPVSDRYDRQVWASEPVPGRATELEILVERSVARQLRPLREQLIANEDRLRLRDLLGGIGYIVGLAGIALWWRSRRNGDGGERTDCL